MSGSWCLVNRRTGGVVVGDLRIAAGFWPRLAGLQLRRPLPAGRGLLLVPCSSVHTCWMRFAIDVVGIGGDGRVTAVKRALRPWRAATLPRGTLAVVETTAGELDVEAGDRLGLAVWERAGQEAARGQPTPVAPDPRDVPAGLEFLALARRVDLGRDGVDEERKTSAGLS